jgi:hypothetical protein
MEEKAMTIKPNAAKEEPVKKIIKIGRPGYKVSNL